MADFKPSLAQQRFYDWVRKETGNCILSAVAGAGKTTTILNGISFMRGKVWLGVYNKKMADEIKEKLSARKDLVARTQFSEKMERVESSTFHSLGFGILRSHAGKGVNVSVDDRKVKKIVEAMILEKEAEGQCEREDLRQIAGSVEGLVSMAKNRGFVPSDRVVEGLSDMRDFAAWEHMIQHFDLMDSIPEGMEDLAMKFALSALIRSNRDVVSVDMDDMVYLPLALNVRLAPWHKFDWVLVDEAQDTNPTRRALARLVMAPRARLVAVGDPHQAIFGFTGADNDALEQIADAFKAVQLPLTVSYRCPQAVVAHARNWVDHIQAHENAPMGSVTELAYQDLLDTLPGIDRADYSEMAILCRYNKYLVGLCFKMIRMGLPAKIEGRSIGENLVKMATRWSSIKTVNALETKVREFEEREVAKAIKAQKEDKADRISDECQTLLTLIDRARAEGKNQITEMVEMIQDMFADNVSGKGLITLCSAHKSKGLEWDNVYLLDRQAFMPSKFAKQDWQIAQEMNLIYVAVTRAKSNLIEVTGVREEKDPTKKEGQ
jgi:superfamily I DNA/RNA helicase